MIRKSSDLVLNNLLDLIMSGAVQPGAKLLPAETLAKSLKFSITSAREAVQNLATIGLVQIIHGRGIFVTEGRPIIEELLEARRAVEPFGAAMAAERIDNETLSEMRYLVDEMDKSIEKGNTDLFNEYDYQFHILMGRAAGNRFIFKTLLNIRDLLKYQVSAVNAIPSLLKASVVRHRQIFEAISGRKPELARQLMEQHITEAVEFWKKNQPVTEHQPVPIIQEVAE
jgi:GntR family transcriptional repressor for pyruvate dehydrogenase complex